jgi:hypothetical protein
VQFIQDLLQLRDHFPDFNFFCNFLHWESLDVLWFSNSFVNPGTRNNHLMFLDFNSFCNSFLAKDLMLGLAFGNFWFQCLEEKNMTPYYLQHSIIK